MLGNKISPASLYTTDSSDESQAYSQASLFGSDGPSSMELFSQSASSSQSQSLNDSQFLAVAPVQRTTQLQRTRQEMTNVTAEKSFQSQGSSSSQKYYMKYLKTPRLAGSRKELMTTPLSTDSKLGGSADSKDAFDSWKCKQAERLNNKHIMDGVISVMKDVTKQVNDTMENLKSEIRGSNESSTSSKPAEQCEVNQLTALQTRTFTQLLQGQEDIKQQLIMLQTHVTQQSEQTTTLSDRISSLETRFSNIIPQFSEQVQVKSTALVKEAIDARLDTVIAKLDCFGAKYCSLLPEKLKTAEEEEAQSDRSISDQSVPTESGYYSLKEHSLYEPHPLERNTESKAAKTNATSQSTGTSCDVDLTQCSPSQCNEVLSQCLQRKKMISSQMANNLKTLQASKQLQYNTEKKSKCKRIKLQSPIIDGVSAVTRRRSQRRRSQPKIFKFSTDDDDSCDSPSPEEDGTEKVNARIIRKIKKPHHSLAPTIKTILSPSTREDSKPMTAATQGVGFFESTAAHDFRKTSIIISSQPTPVSSSKVPSSSAMKFQRSSEATKRSMNIIAGLSNDSVREISASLRQQQLSFEESP